MSQGMDSQRLIELGRELGQVFSTRAAEYDRTATFPVADFDDLREAGLLGVMVPERFGGLGADFLTYTKMLEQIGIGHAATGLTFNMHNIVTGGVAEMDLDAIPGSRGKAMKAFAEWLFDEAVNGKKLFASATTEPGIGAKYSQLQTTYERVDGGYELNGVKSFVSMAGFADYYVVAARSKEETSGPVPTLSFFAVPKEADGIEIEDVWDVLGMRATSSNTMYLRNVFVAKELLFLGSEGFGFFKLLREPHWQVGGYNGVYLGICTAIFEFMTDYLAKKGIAGTDRTAADDRVTQHQVGELDVELAAARALTYEAARLVTESPGSFEANTAIHRAKYIVGELAPRLGSMAIRICGGSTIAKRLPLERLYRDARCGGLMPAKSDDCLSYVGKAALGIDVSKAEESYW
ncbi:MAG TPA: acyl-CoA dehydrogenase [Actinobacteria bacterium]|nr:acyl-CoA dehydrogenase [Actinomycetota bacterium]